MGTWDETVEKYKPHLEKFKDSKYKKLHRFIAVSSFIGLCLLINSMLITTKSQRARADVANIITIQGPQIDVFGRKEHMAIPLQLNDGLPVTLQRGIPVESASLSKNPEVVLTADQVDLVQHFSEYLTAHHETAVITSGERSPEGQLDIIRQRIEEHGATSQFPLLDSASPSDTKVWLAAWNWLRARRVPVNAPTDIAGHDIKTSNHLKGLAIDFIAENLDRLSGWLADFSKSSYAKDANLKIVGIVREPGCIHINLAPQA